MGEVHIVNGMATLLPCSREARARGCICYEVPGLDGETIACAVLGCPVPHPGTYLPQLPADEGVEGCGCP